MKNVESENRRQPKSYFFYDFVKATAALPGLIWFRPKVLYENEAAKKRISGGALLVSNHNTFFDPLYLQLAVWYRRHHFICGIEFMQSRAGWLFNQFHCIPVDRRNFSMDSFRRITSAMDEGKLVSMFPEGHVSSDDSRIDPFKSGMIMMVLKGNHPIIPAYVVRRKHFYDRLVVIIGEPVCLGEYAGGRPTFAQISEMTVLLQKKEEKLREMAEK